MRAPRKAALNRSALSVSENSSSDRLEGIVLSRGKPTIHQLSYALPTWGERKRIRDTALASPAPPMAIAILGASMIELDLELTLRERFPKISDEEWGGMVGEYGPFNTLDQKIATAFAFRIIDQATKHNLKIVNVSATRFAHAKKPIDFNHELIAEELRKVREPNFDKKFHKKLRKSTYLPQDSYVLLCMAVSTSETDPDFATSASASIS
jgi:hypothetical protein